MLKRSRTFAAVLIASCGLAVAAPPGGLAKKRRSKTDATAVIRDCKINDRLTRKYPTSSLKKAYRKLGEDGRRYTRCGKIIKKQIRRQTRRR